MQKPVILKLGGSAITHKGRNVPEARENVIENAAADIKRAREEKDFSLIVVHGAGPYGHKLVSDYGIDDGLKTRQHVEGFVRTHNSMEDLNKIIAGEFGRAGLLGFPVQTSACIIQENKKIVSFNTSIIKALLKLDSSIIPIMYGDVVVDKSLGGSVVSGDAIISYLCRELAADRVLFGTDVPGIYGNDPKINPDAELIEKIDNQNIESVLSKVSGACGVDVTGGMKGKLAEVAGILKGVDVFVFDVTEKGNLYNVLVGNDVRGTRIRIE